MDIMTQSALLEMHNKDTYFTKTYLQSIAKDSSDKDLQANNDSIIVHNSVYRFMLLSNFHDALIKVQKQVVWGKDTISIYVTFPKSAGVYKAKHKYCIDLLDATVSAKEKDELNDIISQQHVFVIECDCVEHNNSFCIALSCEHFVGNESIKNNCQIICNNIRVMPID